MPDWTQLKNGDRIRMVSVPSGLKDRETVALIRRLIRNRTVRTINWIDPQRHPWFDYIWVRRHKNERHSLCLCETDSWVYVKSRDKR